MRILSPLLFAATLAAPFSALADSTLTVTGTATVEAPPDLATLSLGLTTTADTAAAAMAANSASLATVIARLKSTGIEGRDLQTSNLSLNPNWISNASGGSEVQGYTASNMVTIRIRALETTGAVLDAAITDGANTLHGLTFGLQDPRPAEDEARKMAVADAIARATLLSQAAGTTLGPVLSITEAGMSGEMPGPMYRMADAAGAVPVEAGALGLTASVTLVFQITP
jgi:uncharacterized protein